MKPPKEKSHPIQGFIATVIYYLIIGIVIAWAVFPNFYCRFVEPDSPYCIEHTVNGSWDWYSFGRWR